MEESMLNKSSTRILTTLGLGVLVGVGQPTQSSADPILHGRCSLSNFYVRFDATADKFDDTGYYGSSDPMGTLKGGETYRISYEKTLAGVDQWTTTGYDENQSRIVTYTFTGGKPEWNQMSMWGRGYFFSSSGEVFDPSYGLVGHIFCSL